MDYKKTNAPTNTVTRDIMDLCDETGNIYESVAIIGKRANQISLDIKNELSKKLQEFASVSDNLDEVFENREQIEISRFYEKLPKPSLIATQEFVEGKIYFRNPLKEKDTIADTYFHNIVELYDPKNPVCLSFLGRSMCGGMLVHARRTFSPRRYRGSRFL